MKKTLNLPFLIVSLLIFTFTSQAQVSLTTLGAPSSQNFDIMGISDFPLTDNTSIPGVYAFRTAGNSVPNIFRVDAGTTDVGEFKNYGTLSNSDRALGSKASGSTGTMYHGVRYVNNTGVTITSLEVTYTGEQWRNGGNVDPQVLAFSYRQDSTVTDLTSGVYTDVSALDFVTPTTGAGSSPLDGNAAANRATITAGFSVNIPNGQEIMIRWTDINDSGSDHGVAIDDLTVIPRVGAPTAGGASVSGRVAMSNGRGISKAYITLSGGNLQAPVVAVTNPFGYYTFADIPAGQTYVVSISSKRVQFANPIRVLNLDDSLTDIDFIAVP